MNTVLIKKYLLQCFIKGALHGLVHKCLLQGLHNSVRTRVYSNTIYSKVYSTVYLHVFTTKCLLQGFLQGICTRVYSCYFYSIVYSSVFLPGLLQKWLFTWFTPWYTYIGLLQPCLIQGLLHDVRTWFYSRNVNTKVYSSVLRTKFSQKIFTPMCIQESQYPCYFRNVYPKVYTKVVVHWHSPVMFTPWFTAVFKYTGLPQKCLL